ncbi:MAG: glycoside hydrolase family 43 protein [Clostridia bacterium]|nr:glycoside hydrolase family 43 protein [Clostridia bacterium]
MIITDITKIGDPQIVLYDGKYYCYATDCNHYSTGFCVWVSEDLVNWSDAIYCFDAIKYWGESHFWAPEVVYHNGKFVMHYTSKSRELKSLRLGVAVSDSPTGPFVDVHGRPMFDLGYATIDGSVLRCDEGNFFYYSRDCCENYVNGIKTSQLYCVRMNDDLTEVLGEHVLVSTPTDPFEIKSLQRENPHLWNEGPCVIKLGDKYVMNYSANYYATNDYAICVSVADSPMGPFVKSHNNPVLSCREDLFGAGHNAFFYTKEGKLYTAFHIQTNPDNPSGDRRTVIGEVSFCEENGEIKQSIE